ncbi:hypothetical protein BDV96DRAFT_606442 [Lophiotrema nucula]|uniref:Uncharacterized protein n=1 Tax=Lophiotrema nucula TaxID=690887 RepID=A0A6A5YKG7_9PLEO|nr:hypothetical protein BDV96DRAFT_606442 [Lophiotrema nucula]
MTSWFHRSKGPSSGSRHNAPEPGIKKTFSAKSTSSDPNAPIRRFQLHQRCLYERTLPGQAFVSAHVNRLQHGYYSSKALHEGILENVYFVSVHFVFHPQDHRSHRFKSSTIKVSIHGDDESAGELGKEWYTRPPPATPRILGHAPELLYGAVSPETLQWNFSLSSSLGVSHTPVAATVNPSGGVRGNYKIYDMMSIQGSVRSIRSPYGPEYDIEDAQAVWTLEENKLQRSGLPREFDFVLLVHRPEEVKKVYLTVDVDTVVDAWFGEFPQWYQNLSKYQPSQDYALDFDGDIGQRFLPIDPEKGFNFADLPHPLDEYVMMPGTVYPTNDTPADKQTDGRAKTFEQANQVAQLQQNPMASQQPSTPTRRQSIAGQTLNQNQASYPTPTRPQSWAIPETLNVRVTLEHSPQSSSSNRYSGSPAPGSPYRQHSVRRKRSRSGLKEYGAQQALREIANENLNGDMRRMSGARY